MSKINVTPWELTQLPEHSTCAGYSIKVLQTGHFAARVGDRVVVKPNYAALVRYLSMTASPTRGIVVHGGCRAREVLVTGVTSDGKFMVGARDNERYVYAYDEDVVKQMRAFEVESDRIERERVDAWNALVRKLKRLAPKDVVESAKRKTG